MTTDTTFEEAKRCPRCTQPGEQINAHTEQRPRRGLATIYTIICRNERCNRFDRTWIIQVNADGTIPIRQKGAKEFPSAKRMVSMGSAYVDYLRGEMERGETKGIQ
jgi:hypothetical protein